MCHEPKQNWAKLHSFVSWHQVHVYVSYITCTNTPLSLCQTLHEIQVHINVSYITCTWCPTLTLSHPTRNSSLAKEVQRWLFCMQVVRVINVGAGDDCPPHWQSKKTVITEKSTIIQVYYRLYHVGGGSGPTFVIDCLTATVALIKQAIVIIVRHMSNNNNVASVGIFRYELKIGCQ